MIHIVLQTRQVRELQTALKKTGNCKLRGRIQVVLMSHRGHSREDAAANLGITPRTLQRYLNAYLDCGLDGLQPRKMPGRPPLLTEALAEDIRAWVRAGPVACGLRLANWTFEALAEHLLCMRGVRVRKSAMHAFCRRHGVRPYRPTYRYLRGDPIRQQAAAGELAALKKGLKNSELILLAQDEARCPMVPTLCTTLGVKGHRPVVGTRDNKDLLHVFATINCLDARLHTGTLASEAKVLRSERLAGRRAAVSKTRRMTLAFAAHLRHVAAAYPAHLHRRVVLIIDNAPWHRGQPVKDALVEHPHLELYRLPPYSPQMNVIERLWKILRRRSTHNRLFDTLADLKRAVRDALRYFKRGEDCCGLSTDAIRNRQRLVERE